MGRHALGPSTGRRNETLDRRGVVCPCKLLLLILPTRENGDGEAVGVDPAVEVEDVENLFLGIGSSEESRVTFLPQELSRAEEEFCQMLISSGLSDGYDATHGGS